jgi:hypothetical protein
VPPAAVATTGMPILIASSVLSGYASRDDGDVCRSAADR